MDVLEVPRWLADTWAFCLVMAGVGVYCLVPLGQVSKAALAVPAFGFLVRKILLFVPVCGAVSTADQVVFWSPGAWVFHVLLLGCLIATLLLSFASVDDRVGCFIPLAILFLLGLAYMLLPLDGLGIVIMPVVGVFSLLKALLVSPVLLVACWVGFVAQTLAWLASWRLPARWLNAPLVILVVLSGAIALLGQGFALLHWRQPTPVVTAIHAAPFRLAARNPNEPKEDLAVSWRRKWLGAKHLYGVSPSGYPEWFLYLWRERLGEIDRNSVNLVEKDIALAELPPLSSTFPDTPGPWAALGVGVLALGLISLRAERHPTEPRRIPAIPKGDLPCEPLHSFRVAEMRESIRQALTPVIWRWGEDTTETLSETVLFSLRTSAGAAATVVAAALLPPLLGRWGYRMELEAFGDLVTAIAGLVLLVWGTTFLFALLPPIYEPPEQVEAVTDLLRGHRRGRVVPASLFDVLAGLVARLDDRESLLAGQPPVVLLACLDHPNEALRREALRLMPPLVLVREAKRLAESPYVDCRVRIARTKHCPRPIRVSLLGDKDQGVRNHVMRHLGDLSSKELDRLTGSRYPDVRHFVVAHPGAGQPHWMELAVRDEDAGVREAALGHLETPSEADRARLLGSKHSGTRLFALALAGVTAEELRTRCGDHDAKVARAAFARLTPLATAQDLETLAINPAVWEELASHPRIPTTRLRQLLTDRCRDTDALVARAAFTRLIPLLSETDIGSLAFNPAIWQEVITHPLMPHRRVAELLSQFVPRSVYIVDEAAEGYEDSSGPYGGGGWIETRPERGHNEYGPDDIGLASRLIGPVPGRGPSVLAHLSVINPELHGKLTA